MDMPAAEAFTVTPTVRREHIERGGIEPSENSGGVNMFSTLERAQRWAQRIVAEDRFCSSPNGTADIWRVDVTGLAIERIDDDSGLPDRACDDSVESSRLTLLETR